jgi:hypothetical protein
MIESPQGESYMIISDFTEIELDHLRKSCNFVGNEREVFDLRSRGIPLELIAEQIHLSVDGVKKISRKVNRKIVRASGGECYDKRGSDCILEKSL